MKLARMAWDKTELWAEIVDDLAYRSAAPGQTAQTRDLLGPWRNGRLLAPIMPHNKIVALLDNFDGKKGRGGPGLFVKPMSTVIGDGDTIHRPHGMGAPNQEVELGVVIGRRAREVLADQVADYVLGYTVTNDVTCFPVLEQDGFASLSTRFKMFDTFMPIGPWIETEVNPEGRGLRSFVNGALQQSANIDEMAFTVAEVVAWVSAVVTLEPGDIISMGTPPGFAPMASGDVVICEIDGIGALRNTLI